MVFREPPQPQLPVTERVYLCRRLDHLNHVIANLEELAAISTGMRAQQLLARAGKHRARAERIRSHLRARGS